MKKLFTVSLVAIMAVSAAHADIASTGYVDGKTGSVEFTADTVKGSANLTAAVEAVASAVESVAGGSIKLTPASAGENVTIGDDGKINVAAPGTGLNADALTGADFVANVSETNGVISATAGTFQKSIATDESTGEATNASETTAPTTAAITGFVESYVGTQMGVLDDSVTDITDMLGEGFSSEEEGGTVAEKIAAAQSAATSAANSYTDQQIEAEVKRADAAYDTAGAAEAAKNAAIQDAAGKYATTGALGEVSTVANAADALSKANQTNKQDKANTDYQLGSNGSWIDLAASMPTSCKSEGGVCTIVAKSGKLYWEVVAGGSTPAVNAEIKAVEVAAN